MTFTLTEKLWVEEKLKRSILEHMEKGYDVVMEAKCAKNNKR